MPRQTKDTFFQPVATPDYLVTSKQIEECTGVIESRLQKLIGEGHLPKVVDGLYFHNATILGIVNYYRRATTNGNLSLIGGKDEKIRKENELLQMEIDQAKGLLVEVANVDRVWSRILTGVRQVIISSRLNQAEKKELCRMMREIPLEEYSGSAELRHTDEQPKTL